MRYEILVRKSILTSTLHIQENHHWSFKSASVITSISSPSAKLFDLKDSSSSNETNKLTNDNLINHLPRFSHSTKMPYHSFPKAFCGFPRLRPTNRSPANPDPLLRRSISGQAVLTAVGEFSVCKDRPVELS